MSAIWVGERAELKRLWRFCEAGSVVHVSEVVLRPIVCVCEGAGGGLGLRGGLGGGRRGDFFPEETGGLVSLGEGFSRRATGGACFAPLGLSGEVGSSALEDPPVGLTASDFLSATFL